MNTKTLTTKNLQAAFGVSHMTISAWRKGTATRTPLPTSAASKPTAVLFNVGPTQKWASKHGIPILIPLEDLVGQGVSKPGPKPKQVAALLQPKPQNIRKANNRKVKP